jgi:hypothetical protein
MVQTGQMQFNDDGQLKVYDQAIADAVAEEAAITFNVIASPLVKVTDTFTRPNTTTQYLAADEVSNHATQASAVPLHFVGVVGANAGTGYLVKAVLEFSRNVTTNAIFRLWLFNAAPTMVGDNLAYSLLHSERAARVGYVDFALITEGGSSDCAEALDDGLRLAFKCGAASKDLWGVLVAKAGYTPAGLEVVTVYLVVETA